MVLKLNRLLMRCWPTFRGNIDKLFVYFFILTFTLTYKTMAYNPALTLAKLIEDSVPDLRLKNAVFLDYLSSRGNVQKATKVDLNWNAIAAGSVAAVAPMTTAGTSQATGDAVPATLPIGAHKIYHQFDVPLVDLVNSRANGIGRLKNLFKENIYGGMLAIRRQLNTLLWTGDGAAASAGIFGISTVADPTLSYAGINPATFTQWVPIVSTSGTSRALTRNLLYDYSRLQTEQEVYSTAMFGSPLMGQTYNNLFDNVAGSVSVQNTAGGLGAVDLGFGTRSYMGVPLIEDPQMPNGRLIGMNANDVTLLSLDLGDADAGQVAALGLKSNVSSIASADVGGLVINVALLPQVNPGIMTFQMFVLPQLKVSNRRSVSGILNLL